MPNIGGPQTTVRKIYSFVAHSIILYGAEVWALYMKQKNSIKILKSVQRRILLRVCCGYRTASHDAVQVITATPPIELLAMERAQVHSRRDDRAKVKEETLVKWQELWRNNGGGTSEWTRRLIPEILPWYNFESRKLDFFMTQFLTGHGSFGTYLLRFHLKQNDSCLYCGSRDSPEHAIYSCNKWKELKENLERKLGEKITVENTVRLMLRGREDWESIQGYIVEIVKTRTLDEKKLESGQIVN